MIWYTYRMGNLLTSMIDRHMAAFHTAEALESALLNQKGFVTYYFIDNDQNWLNQLSEYRQIFSEELNKAKFMAGNPEEQQDINAIEKAYNLYTDTKDQVIDLYKNGNRVKGNLLHKDARQYFFQVLELCENYKSHFKSRINLAKEESSERAITLRIIAIAAMVFSALLGTLLAFVLVTQILLPIRKLAFHENNPPEQAGNEVMALSQKVYGLMHDVDQTTFELEKSREHLLQAEKMALVGKLAAGMAHSIRNPFTSVNMRLFSLERTLQHLDDTQKDDLNVISQEIRHIDAIIQNFLEFSRPPKLKFQEISPSTIIDSAIQLLSHRLKSYGVSVKVTRKNPLPKITCDPEQIKEVLVNIIVNACESMNKTNGHIIIREEEVFPEPLKKSISIRISDDGPGIPETIRKKIFQPFFTTKEEGTGLGLSIADRIIKEHHGLIEAHANAQNGTVFIITLPVEGPDFEHYFNN